MGPLLSILVITSLFLPITQAEAQINEGANSQNLQILQASVFPLSVGGADITIEHDSALVPEIGPLGTASDIKSEYLSDEIITYVVRKGDTLGVIAKMFDISQNTIVWANDLKKGQALKEGTVLVILPVSGIEYTIKKGDTLGSIAKKFNGDIDEIGVFNGITVETILAVGDEIIIPDGEIVSAPVTSGSGSVKPKPSYSGPEYAGYFMKPISGGRRTQGVHGHNGVDLASYSNAPILASADGTVIISRSSGWNGGYGKYVVLSHSNGTQTLYAHLNASNVVPGQKVKQGDTIGYMGNTGKSTGTHLHFEIRGAKNPF